MNRIMKKYLGVKLIEAEPAKGYNNKLYTAASPAGVETQDGYKVVYENSYTSWSPKDVFEKAYRPIEGLTFGLAIEALKQGKLVARKGWNGIGMFLFIRPSDNLTVEFIQTKVKSLPQSFKDSFIGNLGLEEQITFREYICMFAADGTVVNGWAASQTDILAEDWFIMDAK